MRKETGVQHQRYVAEAAVTLTLLNESIIIIKKGYFLCFSFCHRQQHSTTKQTAFYSNSFHNLCRYLVIGWRAIVRV